MVRQVAPRRWPAWLSSWRWPAVRPSASASEEPERTTAEGVGSVEQAPDANPAVTYVPLPDLGFAHRRPDGGINLFRSPLSDLEGDVGEVYRVRSLPGEQRFPLRPVEGRVR